MGGRLIEPPWTLPHGRIENIRYGSDDIARTAEIMTNAGKYIRLVVKLIRVLGTTLSGPEIVANAK